METVFKGKIWKFGDDIDTDTIIPGKRGTIPTIEEMKKYAFELLKPEFGSTVQPGDILVAGRNFGCGSSREQAATVLSGNGVRCIIARSFARIFFRNAFNSGILLIQCDGIQDFCQGGDMVTVEVGKCVRVNGKEFPVGKVPENLLAIVEHGGLIEDTKMRIAAGIPKSGHTELDDVGRRKTGYTLVEKLLKKNAGLDHVQPGDIVITHPDMFMIHDIYTPYLLDTLEKMGAGCIDDPDKVTIIFDHCMPTAVAKNDYAHYNAGIALAEKYGIKKLHIGEGICHSIMHEERYARPGDIATATDSHTTTYGGAGNFCSGIGTAEMAVALITGELWFKVPEAIKIVLNGHLQDGVLSKDVILKILGDIRADGGQYKSLEFTGPAAREMSMMARFTVANMALEAGAKCGLFEADEKTAEYYDMPLNEIDWVKVDEDAVYEKVLVYDVSGLEPQLSCPQGVDNVHPVSEILGTKMDEVYIGSCTNGSLEDMRIAAEIMKGKKVPEDLRVIVVPATNKVFKDAIAAGYIKTFIEAGCVISHPCCGLCCGMPYGLMYDDERILSTANRNFIGRQGTKKTLSYLSSPAGAAATALTGVVTDPRHVMIKDFEQLKEMLKNKPVKRTVAVVAAHDEHTLEAVSRAAKDGMISPVLIGNEDEIRRLMKKLDFDASLAEIISMDDPVECARKAVELAKAGKADCIMKGKLETGTLMKVLVNKENGIRKNDVMSLLAFMESPHYHKVFAITDVGLLTYPTQEQKKAAIENAVEAFHSLGVMEPKVAVIAAVEKVNPKMKETVEADAIKAEGVNGCVIEGPISYDLAMDSGSAAIKGYESPVAGDADLLVMPDIVSGNVAAKTITCIGGGRTGGTVLGAMVPVLLVSRSASADDKYMSIVISALIGTGQQVSP